MTVIAEVLRILLPQLLVAAPLGFVGLLMLLDPEMFAGIVHDVVAAIRRFEMALRADWPGWPEEEHSDANHTRTFVRFTGCVLILMAFSALLA